VSLDNTKKLLEEYKKAVDVSSIVSKTDPKGIITFANDAFCKISGYSKEELIGSPHNILRHPDMPASAFKEMWETISAKEVWKGIVKNIKKDGGFYYVSATIVPIVNEKDEIEEFIALRQDITELKELNNHLEERVAEEAEKNRKKDSENISTLKSFLNSSPNPIIVYDNDKVKFANDNFLNIFELIKDELCDTNYSLESLFEERSGFLTSLSDINTKNYRENKVSINSSKGRRIYYLIESTIVQSENDLKMYTFNDITLNEYQKLKIKHYSQRLEDFISRKSKQKEKQHQTPIVEEAQEEPTHDKELRELSKEEANVLKASREGKAFSAEEYAKEIDNYVLTELQELIEIEQEIEEALTDYEDKYHIIHLHTVANRYAKYSSIINSLFEFKDLAFAISSLSNILEDIDDTMLNETQQRKISIFLSSLGMDLSNWRRAIFVDKIARDIHYLDSSLFSTILQLELVVNDNEELKNDEEDELELF
jgi:PAS domain S-box-containing protein